MLKSTRTIGTRLFLATGLAGALFLGSLTVAISGLRSGQATFNAYAEESAPELLMYTQLYASGLQTGQAIRNAVLDPSRTPRPTRTTRQPSRSSPGPCSGALP